MGGIIKRKDVDDFTRRNTREDSYKNRIFNGKRTTIDEYTGEKLFYDSKNHFKTTKTVNIDHIVPIDQLIKKYSNSFSAKEIKEIANADFNLVATSESLNKSKSNMSNNEYLYKQLKRGNTKDLYTSFNMLKEEISANTAIEANLGMRKIGKVLNINDKTIFNVSDTVGNAVYAGNSAAMITLVVSSISNISMIVSGKKDIKDATKDLVEDTSSSFVSTMGIELTQNAIKKISKNSSISGITNKMLPIAEIATIVMVSNSVKKFVDGDISSDECVTEILMNGAGSLALALAPVTGGTAIVTSIVIGAICHTISNAIFSYKRLKKLDARKNAEFNKILIEANIALENQRTRLIQLKNMNKARFKTACDKGFEQIFISSLENNVTGISQGLNCILSSFNQNCKFNTLEEFNDFFNNTEMVFEF